MQWVDEALILDCGNYSEHAAIVHLFSREHGRYSGVSKAARATRNRATYQAGNLVEATWKARLSEHMGSLSCELVQSFAALVMTERLRLSALISACGLVRCLLAERDPHPQLYDALRDLLLQIVHADAHQWQVAYCRFELLLLKECGAGLDLSACAATGVREDLVYVSPKSGRAVNREAGRAYHDRLLTLPAFLLSDAAMYAEADIAPALRLTGYFIESYLRDAHHRPLPEARERLISLLSAK
jgi:DNA repair protein RecO (recombination protein O)